MARRTFRTLSDVFGDDEEKPAPQQPRDDVGSRLDALEKKIDELTKITTDLPDALLDLLTS